MRNHYPGGIAMEETPKNLWTKKADDMTVGDAVLVSIAVPVVMIGGTMLVGAVFSVGQESVRKVRQILRDRRNNDDTTEK
jgi:hypothetical protein